MKILFFGTSDFAVPALEALLCSPSHEVIAVVTQPDRPTGRGLQLHESRVKQAASRHGLPVLQPKRVRAPEFLETAKELAPDVLVLAAFGQIIPQALLDLPPYGPINIHGSLLPSYRGAAPIQHAILNGETVTGVTTMWMDATLDTGDILLKSEIAIDPEDTTGTLTAKMAEAGAKLVLETLERLQVGTCPRVPQDHSLATYAPAITSADQEVRWAESAERTHNRIRMLSPRPGAVSSFAGRRIKIWGAKPLSDTLSDTPGEIDSVGKETVRVATGEGTLELLEVQPENSRRMSAADWARGARVKVGDRFDLPVNRDRA